MEYVYIYSFPMSQPISECNKLRYYVYLSIYLFISLLLSSVEYVVPEDRIFGTKSENGSWSGVMGLVLREVSSAVLAENQSDFHYGVSAYRVSDGDN